MIQIWKSDYTNLKKWWQKYELWWQRGWDQRMLGLACRLQTFQERKCKQEPQENLMNQPQTMAPVVQWLVNILSKGFIFQTKKGECKDIISMFYHSSDFNFNPGIWIFFVSSDLPYEDFVLDTLWFFNAICYFSSLPINVQPVQKLQKTT